MSSSEDFNPEIDPHALDREWVAQPRMYYEWAARLADARRDADLAKQELDVVEAETELDVRDNPGDYDLDKVTEATVKAVVAQAPKRIAAAKAVTEAKHRADVLAAAVSALDHRKKALEKLVELHLANYYSEPRARGETRPLMEEAEKREMRKNGIRRRARQ